MAGWMTSLRSLACLGLAGGLVLADGPPDVGLNGIGPRPEHDTGLYAERWSKDCLAREGGSEGTELAVWAALRWLSRHQSPDGRWDADCWTVHCRAGEQCEGPGTNRGQARTDVGVTALALLAFLGNGHSHVCGVHAERVRDGLSWLCSRQREDGSLGRPADTDGFYDHVLATLALAEAYALSRDPALQPFAEKALSFCVVVQDWDAVSEFRSADDMIVASWLVQALRAGEAAGWVLPPEALRGAEGWFRRAADPSSPRDTDRVPSLNGALVFSRTLLGVGPGDDGLQGVVRALLATPPRWPEGEDTRWVDVDSWYFGTNAVFQAGASGEWKTWNHSLLRALLPRQRSRGCEDGSWDPVGRSSLAGGRVHATAMSVLSLEVYYRLPRPLGQHVRPVERE